MHDYITGGFTSNTSLHAVIDRQKIHGIHFRVLAKCLRMSGGDHLHSGTAVGKLEGDRAITLGFVDLMREECVQQDRSRGVFFTQDWAALPAVMPVASGGIHIWHMPALVDIFAVGRFSNYEMWLVDPTRVKPAAQIVYGSKALLQDTVNGETGGGSSQVASRPVSSQPGERLVSPANTNSSSHPSRF
jgi:hypothetical protein